MVNGNKYGLTENEFEILFWIAWGGINKLLLERKKKYFLQTYDEKEIEEIINSLTNKGFVIRKKGSIEFIASPKSVELRDDAHLFPELREKLEKKKKEEEIDFNEKYKN